MPAPIALQLYSVRDALAHDFAGVIRKVAQMGYLGVETASTFASTTPKEAARLFKDLYLAVPGAHLPLPVGDQKAETIETAQIIGSPCIISGRGPDDFKTVDGIRRTCDAFNQANENVRAQGLRFGVHNHWWEYLKVEGDGRYAYEIMLEYLDSSIFLELDTYWIKTAGVDPAEIVKLAGKRAPLLHIKDGPCVKGEPHTAVGDGVMDIPAVVWAGAASTKWLIVEIDRCATDMTEAVARSCDYLVQHSLGRGRGQFHMTPLEKG